MTATYEPLIDESRPQNFLLAFTPKHTAESTNTTAFVPVNLMPGFIYTRGARLTRLLQLKRRFNEQALSMRSLVP